MKEIRNVWPETSAMIVGIIAQAMTPHVARIVLIEVTVSPVIALPDRDIQHCPLFSEVMEIEREERNDDPGISTKQ